MIGMQLGGNWKGGYCYGLGGGGTELNLAKVYYYVPHVVGGVVKAWHLNLQRIES